MAGANDDDDDRNNQSTAHVRGKRGNKEEEEEEDSSTLVEISCSICLELVIDDGSRSMAKLQCGHQFHLDCIGSAFNMKGTMQCPNCRNVEKGQWLFANASSTRLFPEFVMEDWIPDEDLYALSYPEMQYRVHWCPFGELSQAASFDELEPSATTYHNEFHGPHAIAMNHSYPAYVAPGPASTPRTRDNSNNADDHPWNSHSTDHFHQLSVAPHYHHHHHHHHSTSFSLPRAHVVDGEIDSSAARGISHPHPFLFSYRSSPRTSPAANTQQGSSSSAVQMREHLHTQQQQQQQQHHVYSNQRQHHVNGPNLASPLVSVTRRGLQPLPTPDQNVGFFIYPPPQAPSTSGERESDQFHPWERDWFPHFPLPSIHRTISSFWHRHF